ncbi:DUF1501 domain-containing protein [Pendulispora brunnea]|uniref:DUF1501 domain-containing protein n=1 Tax=Pendulispora brunnea TaxID=2905690 RepID=A0ABZ2K694_9BACT
MSDFGSKGPAGTSLRTVSRRGILQLGAFTAAAASIPFARLAIAQGAAPRHFFLHILISGGIDSSYLFDARPLRMTDKGRHANYLYKNSRKSIPTGVDAARIEMEGSNGTKTLRTSLVNPLMAHAADFSILNGVLMSKDADGHGSNARYAITNQSNEGFDSFLPMVGERSGFPIEAVLFGFLPDGASPGANFSKSIQFRGSEANGIGRALANGPKIEEDSALIRHIQQRQLANAQGTGMFSEGSKKLHSALRSAPSLSSALQRAVGTGATSGVDLLAGVAIAFDYFRSGVTSAATVVYNRDPILDVHGADSAAGTQIELLGGSLGTGSSTTEPGVTQNLARLFELLKGTPVDPNNPQSPSFFDVTTVCIHTEFARTMVNLGFGGDVGNTGTDHNPLSNTVILAGNGIRGGLILGESDCTDVDDNGNILNVSGAHFSREGTTNNMELRKVMGKPFDFATMKARSDLPATFQATDYLNFSSVANTVMDIFGIDRQQQFRVGGNQAPILTTLRKPIQTIPG